MSSTIRSELSRSNRYWIERHRYYELKHFCLQYHSWKKAYSALDSMPVWPWSKIEMLGKSSDNSSPIEHCAEERERYSKLIDLVERTAFDACPDLASYILRGVVEDCSYTLLRTKFDIPCARDTYYEAYRKFFWMLDKRRG